MFSADESEHPESDVRLVRHLSDNSLRVRQVPSN